MYDAIRFAMPWAVAVLWDTVLTLEADVVDADVVTAAVATSVEEAPSASSPAAVTGLFAVWVVAGVTAAGRV